MTRRERLRRCDFHEALDRSAVYSRTGFPEDDPTYDRLKAYLVPYTELKGGGSGLAFTPSPPTETAREPHTADFDREVILLRTPAGPCVRPIWPAAIRNAGEQCFPQYQAMIDTVLPGRTTCP